MKHAKRKCLRDALTSSAPAHTILRHPQRGGDGLSGAAALQGPAEHPSCHILLVQGQPADKPAAQRQCHLSNQPAHGNTGELVGKEKECSVCSRTLQVERRNGFLPLQEFKAVAKEDTGRYSCQASNGVGPSKMCEGKHMTIGVCV